MAASDWCHDHVESAFIGYVCIAYMSPLVGMAMCLKSFLCWYLYVWYLYTLSHRLYIYIYLLFCGDPFFHLRAHPTQMMG